MNKENLKNISEYLYELGCNLDDELEILEKNISELENKINILSPILEQYSETKKLILNDFFDEHIKREEYYLCLRVADSICLKTVEELECLKQERMELKGKIDAYKSLINKIKHEYDETIAKIRSLKTEKQEEKVQKKENISPLESLLRRPVGTHPGNILAERRKNG